MESPKRRDENLVDWIVDAITIGSIVAIPAALMLPGFLLFALLAWSGKCLRSYWRRLFSGKNTETTDGRNVSFGASVTLVFNQHLLRWYGEVYRHPISERGWWSDVPDRKEFTESYYDWAEALAKSKQLARDYWGSEIKIVLI